MTFEQDANGRTTGQPLTAFDNKSGKLTAEKELSSKNNASGSGMKDDISNSKKVKKTIFAVGGSKGGAGKSAIAANLAVGLTLLGQKVVLADLDLGGANVHLYVGVKSLLKTWNDFLDKKVASIKEILTPTPFEGLSLIGGDSSKLGSENLSYH